MDGKFSLNCEYEGEAAVVILAGIIDEDIDFSKISGLKTKSLIFNFQKVTGINSCGIREWINFITKMANDHSIIYRECPQIIIEQMNMVKGFFPKEASIESFYAPFYCDKCDSEEKRKLSPQEIKNFSPPQNIKCSKCGNENMEFDAIATQYFHFLK